MAFANDAEFQDDFRKVGHDVTAGFETVGAPDSPTEYASSENVEVAGAAKDEEEDDLEDEDDDVEEDDVEPDDDDLEDDDEDLDDADDLDEDEDDEDFDDDDEDDDEEDEDEDKAVMARLGEAEKTARAR